jgi:polar amino acid transport system substrate-binding protein
LSRRWLFWGALLAAAYVALAAGAVVTESPPPRQPGEFVWGGDRTGGGPYLYEENGEFVGFETELADYLAGELGERSRFVQGQWDKVLALLSRKDVDAALNGYEWSAEREKTWPSTVPYYIYRLQLLVRDPDDPTNPDPIRSWDDLRARPGKPRKRVGVLSSSGAQRYLEQEFGNDVDVLAYSEGVSSAMGLVRQGQLDATVQDYPASVYYRHHDFPELYGVPELVAPGFYVMYLRPDEAALRDGLNEALRKAIQGGKLKELYARYGIWTEDQERLADLAAPGAWPPKRAAQAAAGLAPVLAAPEEPDTKAAGEGQEEVSWGELWGFALLLARAALTTVLLSCLAMPLAILLGLLVAVWRLYGPRWLAWLPAAYVEFLRGTPLMLQLFVIFFVLPELHVYIPAFWAGVLGLAINYSAYEAENYRAGLLAIPRGQMEAALALGMTRWTALIRVIIPQAVRIVIPPVTNDFIALFKDTAVCSAIAVTELTGRYNQLYNNHPTLLLQFAVITALLYLLMSYPLSLVARRLERQFPRVAV